MKLKKMAKILFSGSILARLPQILPPNVFSWVLSPLDAKHFRKLSFYSTSTKRYDLNSRKWQKTLILGLI